MAPPLETDLDEDMTEAVLLQNKLNDGQNGDYVSYASSTDFLPPSEMSTQPLLFERKLETLLEESPNKSSTTTIEDEPKYAQVKLKRNNVIEKSTQQ